MIPAGINHTKKLVAKIFVKPYNISRTGESCENKERASGILVMTSFSSERICFFRSFPSFSVQGLPSARRNRRKFGSKLPYNRIPKLNSIVMNIEMNARRRRV